MQGVGGYILLTCYNHIKHYNTSQSPLNVRDMLSRLA
nr:MAG TPA: Variant erythrocyte surface antigen-1 [Caudoviricetes sp.]